MAEITPSLPNAHIIRTYTTDYAPSDTGSDSEGEARFEADTDDEEQHSIFNRLEQNQRFMDQQMTPLPGVNTSWVLDTQSWKTTEGTPVVLIRKPTASHMSHRLLNPLIYRNIRNVGTLNDLAVLLDAPDDWEDRYNHQVVADEDIIWDMDRFRNLSDETAEADIQFQFGGLVAAIARSLRVRVRASSETKIIVGGILARYEYDLRSKTDPHFLNTKDLNLMASEVKTHRTFAPGDMWYHDSRGIQVLSALYAFNAPTFLLTQRQWKLFIENSDRNAILTFPYDDDPNRSPHLNSSLVQPMGKTFLKAIAICLLSRRVTSDEPTEAVTPKESSYVNDTPKKIITKAKHITPDKPNRLSARLLTQPKPSYVSGYNEKKQPIYSLVRVIPQVDVARIEDEINVQEKKELLNQSSETTLFE